MTSAAYYYLDKENRRKLRAMPAMTPGTFNKHFTNFYDKIVLSLTNEEEADNLRFHFANLFAESILMMRVSVKPMPGWIRFGEDYVNGIRTAYYAPFGEELVNDYLALLQFVLRAIRKEKKKEAIKAAAEGKIAYEDLKQRFPMILTESLDRTKIKIKLYCDLDDAGNAIRDPVKHGFFVWNHWEAIEKKDWYTVEEITACIKKIVDNTMNYHMDKIRKLDAAKAVLEKYV